MKKLATLSIPLLVLAAGCSVPTTETGAAAAHSSDVREASRRFRAWGAIHDRRAEWLLLRHQIRRGMSRDEVLRLLGPPHQGCSDEVSWVYTLGLSSRATVDFTDGSVIQIGDADHHTSPPGSLIRWWSPCCTQHRGRRRRRNREVDEYRP